MYYKQTYKTSCLLDAVAQICGISSREAIKKLMSFYDKNALFNKGGYFKYSPAIRLLRLYGIIPFIKTPHADNKLFKEKAPMILGVNLWPDDEIRPLHAVYYDGQNVWEGYNQKFLDSPEKLKIHYAIVCYTDSTFPQALNKNSYLIETLMWDWDNCKKPAKITGQFSYLEVI